MQHREQGALAAVTPWYRDMLSAGNFTGRSFDRRHKAHRALTDFRVDAAREFFRYPLAKAIALLLDLAEPSQSPAAQYVAEDVTQRPREKYPAYLRSGIGAVRIVQVPGRVWLEITTEEESAGYLVDQIIQRTDLAFIADMDESFFGRKPTSVSTRTSW
ncbi:hypothetical protein [Burkholderia ambifaria]|jgi:hypothetical protein|uniref:hypothetical protein n=1 Tax=Burkholderia TaxID=32008 RepID=UPI0018F423B0|nr:hypothetical protein [Burkholderia ambifaria]MDP9585527.1 hypothetical protein [Burkholderia contaminans]QQK00223.1 hypothetical protein JG536_18165 [Burkholderia ambifaria]